MDEYGFGSRGPGVQLLQLGLSRAGYQPGRIDGSFGRGTENALRQFQQAQGLPFPFAHSLAPSATLYAAGARGLPAFEWQGRPFLTAIAFSPLYRQPDSSPFPRTGKFFSVGA